MPDSKLRFLGDEKHPHTRAITQEAREIAAAYLGEENARLGHESYDAKTIGEIISGKRDYAPAVHIAQFTLNRVKA